MQARRILSIATGFSLLMGIAWDAAEAAETEDHAGVYLGIGAGFGFENFQNTGGLDIDGEAFGFDAWGGYRFNEWIASELQLEYLNGFDTKIFGVSLDGQLVTFGSNVKLFPLASVSERIEPFVIVGPGFTWFELDAGSFGTADELDFSARFGGGIDFHVTDHLALQVSSSYVLQTGDLEDADYVSLVAGIQYGF